ncbi:hypothetical protein [Clavibacter michiganensis]|uniref:hypothetical protein n=1 Tax=Clavibacter michiganensis TaxID=28447 RepID=UPI0011B0595B|nr:hypothetical protein [Clavibacter michiganensis]
MTRRVLISAGAAAEYLLSCLLVHTDPALLADAADVKSLCALSRHNHSGTLNGRTLRTATWGRQATIAQELYKSLKIRDDLLFLNTGRNAAVHSAIGPKEELDETVTRMVVVIDSLLQEFSHPKVKNYWQSEFHSVVDTLRDQRSTEVRRRLSGKVAAAKANYERQWETLAGDAAAREAYFTALEASGERWLVGDSVDRRKNCPACARSGILSYLELPEDEVQSEVTYDDAHAPEDIHYYVNVTGMPVFYQCPVCGLDLEGEELKAYPHLSEEIDLDPEDRSEPGWGEPDEDYLRGR